MLHELNGPNVVPNWVVLGLARTNNASARVVESVGEHVEDLASGDAVVPTFLGQCSECVDCRSARSNMCSKYRFAVRPGMLRDDTSRFTDVSGNPLHHFLGVSSFSEYTVVDVNHVVKVNAAMPPSLACLLSCGASTG
jgi:S-(hydroxymethyl)glutathione dehydrogenase / alcohol dehydrogenase